MKLYHWTRPQNLIGVATGGLEPNPPYAETPYITAGRDVVWLTANPSRDMIEPADLEHGREHGFTRPWLFGDADDVRLTVKFNSTNRRHLFHWREWISHFTLVDAKTGEDLAPMRDVVKSFPPSLVRDCWVCLKRIPVSQIECPPITARVAMLGLVKDSEPYKMLAALPPDTIVTPHLVREKEAA